MVSRSINLTFHGIGEPPRPLEPGECSVWLTHEQFLTVLDQAACRENVAITVDDGNASDLVHVLPALRERGLTATFFVVAERLGKPHFLDEDGVRALAAAGMEIGCHGLRHRRWRGLDVLALHEELIDAKIILEGVVGRPVTRAACPFGSYDRRVLRAARGCGYERVYTSDRGTAHPDEFLQARNSVGDGDDAGLFDRISRLETPAHRAVRRRVKLTAKQWR